MNNTPAVSVIIPCRNEVKHLEACLFSILDQEEPPGGFEVIVVDGMSEDGTRGIMNRFTNEDNRLRILDNIHRHTPHALNIGIQAARGNIILRMDVHTEYSNNYISQCLKVLKESGADNVGGPWTAAGEGALWKAIALTFNSPFAIGGARGHQVNYEGPVDTAYCGCWRREVFDRYGLFDEELVRNQDDEHNLRITRSGGLVWQSPRIRSKYIVRGSLSKLFRQYYQYGFWKVRVIQKHRLPASVRHLIPGLFVASQLLLLLVGIAAFSIGSLMGMTFWNELGAFGWMLLAGLLILYSICDAAASFVTVLKGKLTLFPIILIVHPVFHYAYGLGFLHGLLHFILLRRRASEGLKQLTR